MPGALRGLDLKYDVDITLEEAARGGEREVQITRSEKCSFCHGNGAKPGTSPKPCPDCGGSGQQQQVKTGKGMRLVTLTSCPKCEGHGRIIESPCQACLGRGFQFKQHTLSVRIPPGVDSGMMIRIAGQGEAHANGGPPGDLLIRPHVRPHPYFESHADDLYTVTKINYPQAALGAKIPLTGLAGEAMEITIPAGTQSGTSLRLRGKGMPRLNGKGKGDLLVVAEVITPTNLSAKQRKLLEELAKLESKPTIPKEQG